MSSASFDQAKADAFSHQMIQTLNGGALCLMISVGHRTGLFDKMAGMPPATSEHFHEIMAEESYQTVILALFDSILPLVPSLAAQLHEGIDVLDVGCGRGRALAAMARKFPKSRFTGYDFSEEAIGTAVKEAKESGLKNLQFEVRDVTRLEAKDKFRLITAFDAIHDQAKPREVLKGIATALHPEGIFLMQDIVGTSHLEKDAAHPLAPFLYTVSCMHCMTVSLALDGEGLGTMWGREKATTLLKEAGFRSVEVHELPHDIVNIYYTCRK